MQNTIQNGMIVNSLKFWYMTNFIFELNLQILEILCIKNISYMFPKPSDPF